MSEMRAAIFDLIDRVTALEKANSVAETPASSFKLWPNAPSAPYSAAPSSGVPGPIDADKMPASSIKPWRGVWPNPPSAPYSAAPPSDAPDPIDTDKMPASSIKPWLSTSAVAPAAARPSAAASPESLPIAIVFVGVTRPKEDMMAEIQRLVPDKTVAAMPIDRLAWGQRVIMAVYAMGSRDPSTSVALQYISNITKATGRKPLVMVGILNKMKPEEWISLNTASKELYDGNIVRFFMNVVTAFERWRDGPPTAARLLEEQMSSVPLAPSIAIVFVGVTHPKEDLVAEIQRLVPDKTVAAMSIDRLAWGQRVIMAVYASPPRDPMPDETLQYISDITKATGRKPLVMVGAISTMGDWISINYIPKNEYDGDTVKFHYGADAMFERWRDGPPAAIRLLGER